MSGLTLAISFADDVTAPEIVRLTRLAEEAGFGQVWLPEDLYFRAPMPIAGALAVATRRITLAFGVLTPFNRDASLVAMELVSLLELAGPRVILGLGAGVGRRLERIGVPHRQPVRALADMAAIVRGLLGGETVSYEGVVHRAVDLKLDAPSPSVPPIYVAALGPRSLRQAGAVGDGLILGLMASPEWVTHARDEARQGALAAGIERPDIPTVVYLPTALGPDPAEARRRLKPELAFWLQRWLNVPTLGDLFAPWGGLSNEEHAAQAAALAAGAAPEDVISDDLVDRYCLAGTAADCRRQLDRYARAGVTVVAVRIDAHTPDPDGLIAALASA